MSFVKTQEEVRANLIMQIRDTIDAAEAEGRGLDAAEQEKISRIEDDIRKADEMIAVAKRNEERAVEVAEATRGALPVETAEAAEADIFRAMARGEVRGHKFEARDSRAFGEHCSRFVPGPRVRACASRRPDAGHLRGHHPRFG